jgi:lipopolysaccharide transport system ATP-binding protein
MSQPDIMVVDEALAVGDIKFQAKCMTVLRRRQEAGMTILFVSHDVGAVKSLCSRGIYLDHGEVKSMGTAAEVVTHYIRVIQEEMNKEQAHTESRAQALSARNENSLLSSHSMHAPALKNSQEFDRRVAQFRYGSGEARITYAELLDNTDEPTSMVEFNQEVKIRIYFEAYEQKRLSVNFVLMDDKKYPITSGDLRITGQSPIEVSPGDGYQVDYLIRLPLQAGSYSVRVSLTEPIMPDQGARFTDVIDDAIVFTVVSWAPAQLWSKVYLFPSVEVKMIPREPTLHDGI